MDIAGRSIQLPPLRVVAPFAGIFLALYIGAVAVAEQVVARRGAETAFQRLLSARGEQFDWIVLGASHALPLAYGDVPGRLKEDTGQSMIVLAEVGAGPLYSRFVFDQAMRDVAPKRLLYVIDAFAIESAQWNEKRVADRELLRQTPLRLSTLGSLSAMVRTQGVNPRGLLDYATGFSKLNPPDRFPQDGWQGAANFERSFRPSSHATRTRIDYLYPGPAGAAERARYLDILVGILRDAQAAGLRVETVKLPLPEAFRDALPDEAAFDRDLRDRLEPLGIPVHDLSTAIGDPADFFDTDHLNREGIDRLYREHLLGILATQG